ncbi:thiosulfate oxidation carrier protein SoxY [Lutibaculum baratangense]|uniref:Sulfur oxidation protein SoxY n=1 Tax=Lutibaculum baratangense AMV1 TaxID=631454 RepID=V4RPR2_9HYPH|nr:thiosulfate oxidation carrier protein SoxY [Lutibaculum baratangense]ESR27269.1 Sulfur oxidation protein SoxY [Lutibaculum baratangense AMV1]
MKLTRRQALAISAGAALAVVAGRAGSAHAAVDDTEKAIQDFTGGKSPETGRIRLTAPEIAENGNTVPISVDVESPMTAEDYVASVLILADGNPNPDVATLHFTPMSGSATATTRMRLAKTQNVIAVAKMSDGSVFMDKKEVKVTIGGCGG